MIAKALLPVLCALGLTLATAACDNDKKPAGGDKPTTDEPGAKPAGDEPAEKPAGDKAADKPAAAEPKGEPTEVVLWHAYRGNEKAALEHVVATYNRDLPDNVRIKLQAVPYDPFVDKISITVPRGQGPDLFIFAHNMIGNWAEKKVLEPMSGHVPPEVLKQYLPQSVKAMVYRKNLYGLPLAFKSLVMFYNKKLLPEPPDTMEALVEALEKVQASHEETYGLLYEAGGLYQHAIWIHAFGGRIFDDQHKPAFDTPEQVAALEYARTLAKEHKIVPSGISGALITGFFNDGKAAVSFNGPWFRGELNPDLDYGVATIPTVDGKIPKPLLGIEAIFVTTSSKHKEAAYKAAMYLAGKESAQVRMEMGQQPVAHKEVLEAGSKKDPSMEVFARQADNAVLMDASPEMQLLWTSADIAINGAVFGDKPAKDALEKAQAKMEEDISKRGK